jgi:T5SS/PEP-CTERM-associated repeat protein
MKKIVVLLMLAFFTSGAICATKHWQANEDRDFTNWNNWSSTTVFTGSNDGAVSMSGVGSPIMYSSSTALSTSRNLYIGASNYGEFEIQGSTITLNRIEVGGDYWLSSGDDGAVTQTGGVFNASSNALVGNGNTGNLTISDGSFNVGTWLTVGEDGDRSGAAGSGTVTMTGGSLTADRAYIGRDASATGDVILSGNSTFDLNTYVYVGDSGGAVGNITMQDSAMLTGENISLRSGSYLNFILDIGSSSMMSFSTTDSTENSFDGIIDLSFAGVSTQGTYDLIDFDADMTGTDITGLLSTTSASAGWNLDMVEDGSGSILQATYVPEPTTLAVLALGGIGILRRRK